MSGEKRDETALREEIAALIKAKCKGRTYTTEDCLADAAYIIHADRWSVKRQRAWKPKDETARIKKIRLALDDIIENIRKLPEYLRLCLLFDSEPREAAPKGILAALESARAGIEKAKAEAVGGTGRNIHAIGRTGRVRAGAVLWECRIVWERRTGVPARRTSHQTRRGPFAMFVEAVFGALRIGYSARQALALVEPNRREAKRWRQNSHETEG